MNLVIPVSKLFPRLPYDFVNRFQTIEQKWFENFIPFKKDTIFHSGFSLLDKNFLEILQTQNAFEVLKTNQIRRFSFDIGPCYKQYRIKNNKYYGIGKRIALNEIFDLVEKKIKFLKTQIPDTCELAVENLNYYDTGAYEDVCEPDFYNDICRTMELRLVLDLAHAKVTSINQKINFDDHIAQYDMSLVSEIHLSKTKVLEHEAVDVHDKPGADEFLAFCLVAHNVNNGCDIVVEYYKDVKGVIESYDRLRQLIE